MLFQMYLSMTEIAVPRPSDTSSPFNYKADLDVPICDPTRGDDL